LGRHVQRSDGDGVVGAEDRRRRIGRADQRFESQPASGVALPSEDPVTAMTISTPVTSGELARRTIRRSDLVAATKPESTDRLGAIVVAA